MPNKTGLSPGFPSPDLELALGPKQDRRSLKSTTFGRRFGAQHRRSEVSLFSTLPKSVVAAKSSATVPSVLLSCISARSSQT